MLSCVTYILVMKFSSVHYLGLAAILFENLKNDNGLVIGRADKKYTLWKYSKENDTMNIKFVQVLPADRLKVELRFPDVYICEELRGEHRMVLKNNRGAAQNKPANAPKTIFDFINMPFGSMSGVKISNITAEGWCRIINNGVYKWTDAWGEEFDFEELFINKCKETGCSKVAGRWYTPEQMNNPKLWIYLANNATDMSDIAEYESMCHLHGYEKILGVWMSKTPVENEKDWIKTAREILPLIAEHKPFSFVPSFNGNSFSYGIYIEFLPEDKHEVHTYYGSSYYLKVPNKKGVKTNKRVKGKTIEVLDYNLTQDEYGHYSVIVNKFIVI